MTGVSVEKAGGIARVVFDSPPINLFTVQLFAETARIVAELAVDDEVRVVVLSSANPDFFIAHFDVEAILTFPTDQPPATSLNAYSSRSHAVFAIHYIKSRRDMENGALMHQTSKLNLIDLAGSENSSAAGTNPGASCVSPSRNRM